MVDRALDEALPQTEDRTRNLVQAMRYSLFIGGKRLRPILCLAGAEAVGAEPEAAMPAAIALEMIHTYSLIHDDLPSMDDDDLRRGQPSNHKVFGEALAILAGDALLTQAFFHLARAGCPDGMNAKKFLEALNVIARAAGWAGMVGGQALDIESEGQSVGKEVIHDLHARKTGALMAAAITSGAMLGNGDRQQVLSLDAYGKRIGLAFQITDDLLDIEGDTQEMGKPVGSDQARGKSTYPCVVGVERARDDTRQLVAEAKQSLTGFDHQADPLRAIADYLLTRKN